jgi:hypothetical protein
VYFPYFRAKQEELLALREVTPTIAEDRLIFPILEPVRTSRPGQLATVSRSLSDAGIPHAVIENPQVGDYRRTPELVRDDVLPGLAVYQRVRPAFIIHAGTRDSDVAAFLDRYPRRPVVLIHETSFRDAGIIRSLADQHGAVEYHVFMSPGTAGGYRRVFAGQGRVVVEDVFVRQPRNADYEGRSPEHFTSEHLNYRDDAMEGFGDFGIVGRTFSEQRGGQEPHAVTMHVTYPNEEDRIYVQHFVSDDVSGPGDEPGKVIQAMRKAVAFARETSPLLDFSSAVPEWELAVATRSAPRLGGLKRQTIRHHLELMVRMLRAQR